MGGARVSFLIAMSAILSSCAPSEATLQKSGYREAVATSLGYFSDVKDRRYMVSKPWMALDGHLTMCVERQVPDGRNGWASVLPRVIVFLQDDHVENVVDDTGGSCTLVTIDIPLERVARARS